jgi:elongator complex protein 3
MKNKVKKTDKDILLQIIRKISVLDNPDERDVALVIARHPSLSLKTFSKSQIIEAYRKYKKEIKFSPKKEKEFLQRIKMKKVRTSSGVTPVAIMTKPYPCPGNCIYCPNDPKVPKSYLSLEPGAQRALSNNFDPYLQVYNRLVAYTKIGHVTDKVEIIVLGGTWSFYPESYQVWFIKRAFDALNDFNPKKSNYLKTTKEKGQEKTSWSSLYLAQKINETAKSRCVGLVLETRPDYISQDEVVKLRKLGATKIQIGVQSLSNDILKLNKRGHGVKETENAFRLLRTAGFKIHAHWMPNLYGSTPKKDIEDYKKLFSDKNFKPDELKIYPCSLILNTGLYDIYKKKKWRPYTEKQLLYVLENCITSTPRYCRLTRVIRDISSNDIVAGNKKSNFRQVVEKSLKDKKLKINEIRHREVKNIDVSLDKLSLRDTVYETKSSTEHFLEFVTKDDKIAGFLRLSVPKVDTFINEISGSTIIREVHVYGQVVGFGKEEEGKAQHMGLGSLLIKKAEEITLSLGVTKISVISSIGTRRYYSKKGYKLKNIYQVKSLR